MRRQDLLMARDRVPCKIYLLPHFLREAFLDYPKPQ